MDWNYPLHLLSIQHLLVQVDVARLKDISETLKNFVEVAAILGAGFAVYKFIRSRHDRAVDVLTELERRFTDPKLVETRALIENDADYAHISPILTMCVLSALDPKKNAAPTPKEFRSLLGLDELLRFYVFLHGVREARQAPDSALRASYRYWLSFYFHPGRTAFRAYLDWFYPTLSGWLHKDERRESSWFRKRFFQPADFGWIATDKQRYEQLRRGIDGRVLVITGAGISADSKIPTFRGKRGYWKKLNPRRLATKNSFSENPRLVWDWYQLRRKKILKSKPNQAHVSLVELAQNCKDFLCVTQNVDDLHERAKFKDKALDATQLVHIHGEIFVSRCDDCSLKFVNRDDRLCPKCEGYLRPGVVWFDEENNAADELRVAMFLANGPCDLVLVIGTTAVFDYIRSWALQAAANGAWLVEVNPEKTHLSRFAHHVVRKRAASALPKMISQAVERGPIYLG